MTSPIGRSSSFELTDMSAHDAARGDGTHGSPIQSRAPRSTPTTTFANLDSRTEASSGRGAANFRRLGHAVIATHRFKAQNTRANSRFVTMTGPSRTNSMLSSVHPVDESESEITFKMPTPCNGELTVVDGRLRCDQDHGIQGVLDLLHELDPDAVANLKPPAGARISIEWDKHLMDKMSQFMELAGGNPMLATDLLRDALTETADDRAFTPAARIPGTDTHPSEFLRNMGMHIQVAPSEEIGQCLQSILDREPSNPAQKTRMDKFRSDFGAMSLLALANNKDFNKHLGYALGLSILGTLGIGVLFDYKILPSLKKGLSPNAQLSMGSLLDSTTPLAAETFDSMLIKRLLEKIKGGEFLPNPSEAVQDLMAASYSGTIAAFGSIANNYARELMLHAQAEGNTKTAVSMLALKQITNLIATWTSGAMIPLEVMNDRNELIKIKKELINEGVVPKSKAKGVAERAMNTVRAARGNGTAIRSMAMGTQVSAAAHLILSVLEYFGVVSPNVEQLITLLYSTPVEVESMVASMAAEKWLGFSDGGKDRRFTTDSGKQSALLAQIAGSERTTMESLDKIARPSLEHNAGLGYGITAPFAAAMRPVNWAVYGAAGGVAKGARAIARVAGEKIDKASSAATATFGRAARSGLPADDNTIAGPELV